MAAAIQVDLDEVHQRIDGFGFCQAFHRARLLRGSEGLSPQSSDEVLDLLFGTEAGAGFSILRLGIGSATDDGSEWPCQMRSIAPKSPGDPAKPLSYEWDGDDSGQVWLAQQAVRYGVRRIYASAWSAPGYMMENGTDVGGGAVLGMPGTERGDGDWRAAYAESLLQYVRFYRQCGVQITDVGFSNEADILIHTPEKRLNYAHMRLEPKHVVDFIKVLGPAIQRSGLRVSLVSCDATTWNRTTTYAAAVEADPEAARWVDIHAGHNYHSPARVPLKTKRPTWMSEWDPDVTSYVGWNDRWDSGRPCDGILLAEDINDTITMGGVSAYLYWFAASTGPTRALIQLDGADYRLSKRFWAIAAYSRFIRPGAHRVAARVSGAAEVKVSAFHNLDGSTVVNVLNPATAEVAARLDLGRITGIGRLRSWLTDEIHSLAPGADERVPATITFPARSLTTLVHDLVPDRYSGPHR